MSKITLILVLGLVVYETTAVVVPTPCTPSPFKLILGDEQSLVVERVYEAIMCGAEVESCLEEKVADLVPCLCPVGGNAENCGDSLYTEPCALGETCMGPFQQADYDSFGNERDVGEAKLLGSFCVANNAAVNNPMKASVCPGATQIYPLPPVAPAPSG